MKVYECDRCGRYVANTCGAVVMGLEEWLRALEPADGGKQKGGE